MTPFATDSHLGGYDCLIRGQSQYAGGMATEATQDGRCGIEDAVALAGLRFVSGR